MADRSAEDFADLADLILTIARDIRAHGYGDPAIVQLSSTEVNVMRYVDRHPGVAPSVVAEGTGLQRSNLSKALRALEAKGLVQRGIDESDNRQAVLWPTARAAENLVRLRRSWTTLLAEGFQGRLGPDEVAPVLVALRTLEAGLADHRARR